MPCLMQPVAAKELQRAGPVRTPSVGRTPQRPSPFGLPASGPNPFNFSPIELLPNSPVTEPYPRASSQTPTGAELLPSFLFRSPNSSVEDFQLFIRPRAAQYRDSCSHHHQSAANDSDPLLGGDGYHHQSAADGTFPSD
ncbi:hypothetical protein COCNU_scaffold001302G000060 [Cocos nucifera]|nr:hypothetical protein [Cocos nucifera]